MNEAQKHKDNFMSSNPQLSTPLQIAPITIFHEFLRWSWKTIMAGARFC